MKPVDFVFSGNCPVAHTLNIIGGKWKARILWALSKRNMRTGELKRVLGNVTDKVLSDQLKELINDGLLNRHDFKQIPPKVEYSLTDKGLSILPVIKTMAEWGTNDMKQKSSSEQAI